MLHGHRDAQRLPWRPQLKMALSPKYPVTCCKDACAVVTLVTFIYLYLRIQVVNIDPCQLHLASCYACHPPSPTACAPCLLHISSTHLCSTWVYPVFCALHSNSIDVSIMPNRTFQKLITLLTKTAQFITDNSQSGPRGTLARQYNAAEAELAASISSTAKGIAQLYEQCLGDCGASFEQFDTTVDNALDYVRMELTEIRGEIEYGMKTTAGLLQIETLRTRVANVGVTTSKALNEWSRRLLKQKLEAMKNIEGLRNPERRKQTGHLPPTPPSEQLRNSLNRYSGFSQVGAPQPLNVGKRRTQDSHSSEGTPPMPRPESGSFGNQANISPATSTTAILTSPVSPPRRAIREAVEAAQARKAAKSARIGLALSPASSNSELSTSAATQSSSQMRQLAPKASYTNFSRGEMPEPLSASGSQERLRSKPSLPLRSAARGLGIGSATTGGSDRLASGRRPISLFPATSRQDFRAVKAPRDDKVDTKPGTAYTAAATSSSTQCSRDRLPLVPSDPTATTEQLDPGTSSSRKQKRRLREETPETSNSFGLCPGATLLHTSNLNKALEVRTVPRSLLSTTTFLKCSEKSCTFEGPQKSKSKKTPAPDDTIFPSQSTGMFFRWLFLAKSHLPSSATHRGRGLDASFQAYTCVFCADTRGAGPRFEGTEALMAHILYVHADNMPLDVAKRWNVLLGPVGKPEDDFDLNIPLSCNQRLADKAEGAGY